MSHRIIKAVPRPGRVMEVVFEGGRKTRLDIGPWIRSGGVWEALKSPAAFRKVSIGPGGRYIEWPGEIDVCADAIWKMAVQRQRA